jgi:anthranilate synthase/aminodeoxychorismate synthase-like glutamine amidotransferase
MVLIIDNYDSFTYNIYQYVGQFDSKVKVIKNDEISISQLKDLSPSKIIISPGPGHPDDSRLSLECVDLLGDSVSILGICLGHQAIGVSYGAKIINSNQIIHGKTSMIQHNSDPLFRNINNPFEATRYHSLIIDKNNFPNELEVIADCNDMVMGIKHKSKNVYGVQFHPESIKTDNGLKIIENFINL